MGNILPGHNLILMGDGEKGERLRGLMSSQMINDDVFISESVEAIKEDNPPQTKGGETETGREPEAQPADIQLELDKRLAVP